MTPRSDQKYSKLNSYYLDAIDAQILTQLQVDGRQHNTEIAQRLGVGEATVRKRIECLLRNGVMQIGAWTDPLKIGYQRAHARVYDQRAGQGARDTTHVHGQHNPHREK